MATIFPDDILNYIFMEESILIQIKIRYNEK